MSSFLSHSVLLVVDGGALGAGLIVGAPAEIIPAYPPNRRRAEESHITIDADGREAQVSIPIPAGSER